MEVQFKYTITNDGDDVERIYSITVTRGDMTTILTDLPDVIPTTDLAPGETIVITSTEDIDICQGGPDVFDTQADVLAGPPCDVEVSYGGATTCSEQWRWIVVVTCSLLGLYQPCIILALSNCVSPA